MSNLTRVTSALVKFKLTLVGAVERLLSSKLEEFISLLDLGATGNGIVNDSSIISSIEASYSGKPINGDGRVYLVTSRPVNNKYFNGFWSISGVITPFDYVGQVRSGNTVVSLGYNAAPNLISDDGIAIGVNALKSGIGARNNIAIGKDALQANTYGRHNIAMGISALHFLNGTDSSSISGSRNIGIGGNTGRFLTGSRNIIMGRDAGHNLTDAHLNLIFGNGSVMGWGPNTLNPGVIENQTPLTPSYTLMMGTEAGKFWNAAYGVGLGHNALMNVKSDTGIVGIGASAFAGHQSDLSYWGTVLNVVSQTGTYSQTGGTTITISMAAHGLTTGFRALIRFLTGANGDTTFNDDNWFVVTVVDANTFTIQSPVTATASGNMSISQVSTSTTYSRLTGGCVGVGREVGNGVSNYRSTGVGDRLASKGLGVENSGLGYNVWLNYVAGAGCTAVGAYSQQSNNNASGNTSVGVLTLAGSVLTGVNNSALGAQSLRYASSGANNTAVGATSLQGLTTGSYNTAVGVDALRYQTGTSTAHNYSNATGLGYQAYVSGDNQVQLGNSTTTTYVYGTVQNRSDIRDKELDSVSPKLGIDFILGLEPVQGVWDMRDDYFTEVVTEEVDETTGLTVSVTSRVSIDKDGSKKRTRLHQWFVAQQVAELAESLGVDVDKLGLLQHHAVNGGEDVYSLGYDEFIPPVVSAIQSCWSRLDEMEARIKELEAK